MNELFFPPSACIRGALAGACVAWFASAVDAGSTSRDEHEVPAGVFVKTIDVHRTDIGSSLGYNSMAAAPDGSLFVAFQNVESHLSIARSIDGGGTWNTSLVDRSGPVGLWVDLAALDSERLYVSYFDEHYGDLRFARSVNGGRQWEGYATVDRDGVVGTYTSIAVTGEDTVFISYHDGTRGSLKLARSDDNGRTWVVRTVDDDGTTGIWSSVAAIDSSTVLVSYQDFERKQLRFARSTDGGRTWTRSTVDDAAGVGAYADMSVLGPDRVWIAYRDFGAGRLQVAYSSSGGAGLWKIATVAHAGRAPAWISLQATDSETVALSYLDTDDLDLHVAVSKDGGATWTTRALDEDGDVGRHSSLAVAPDGARFVSYLARGDEGDVLRVARMREDTRVAIGTEDPQAVLHVRALAEAPALRIDGGPGSSSVDVESSTDGGRILARDNAGLARSAVKLGADAAGGRIEFETAGFEEHEVSPRVVLDAAGRLGIGETDPEERLHVRGRARFDSAGGSLFVRPDAEGTRIGVTGGEPLHLFNRRDIITILSDGRVGVGTTTPRSSLEVISRGEDPALLVSAGPGSATARIGLEPEHLDGSTGGWALAARPDGTFAVEDRTGNAALSIDAEGRVGIGADPTHVLTVPRGAATHPIADAWTTYSSSRWKEDVAPIEDAGALVEALRGVRFRWKDGGGRSIGMIAEEVGEVLPEIVQFDEGRASSIDYGRVTAVLVEALKEQSARIEDLERRLESLER